MWKAIASLMLGGSLGALSRWGLHYWIDAKVANESPFPWGILLVNTAGCFLFGWLFGLFENRAWFSDSLQLAVFTGFLGSFTTFSTFSWNTLELLREGHGGLALLNIGLSVILGMIAVWIGFSLAR